MLSTEWQPPEREKIFANHLSNKSLVSKVQRELKFNNKNPIQCLIKYLTNICPKIYKQPVSTWKDLQHYQSLRKYKSKLRRDATSYPGGWLSKSKQKLENNNCRQGCEKKKGNCTLLVEDSTAAVETVRQCLKKLKTLEGNFRTLGLGDRTSSNPERTALKRWGEEPAYIEVLHWRAGNQNIQKIIVN